MPNYCSNKLTIKHDDPAMIARVVNALKKKELFYEFIPVPVELEADDLRFFGPSEKKTLMIEKYGYDSEYEFCSGEWGTKWDICHFDFDSNVVDMDDNEISLFFNTAWGPAIPVYKKMITLGYSVSAYYDSEESGFCGKFIDGEDTMFDYNDIFYGCNDSQDVYDLLGEDLCAEYNFADRFEEYENEDDDEDDE